jgi:hypothetical protein
MAKHMYSPFRFLLFASTKIGNTAADAWVFPPEVKTEKATGLYWAWSTRQVRYCCHLLGRISRAKEAFTDTVYNTRNYLTHYTDELASKATCWAIL